MCPPQASSLKLACAANQVAIRSNDSPFVEPTVPIVSYKLETVTLDCCYHRPLRPMNSHFSLNIQEIGISGS